MEESLAVFQDIELNILKKKDAEFFSYFSERPLLQLFCSPIDLDFGNDLEKSTVSPYLTFADNFLGSYSKSKITLLFFQSHCIFSVYEKLQSKKPAPAKLIVPTVMLQTISHRLFFDDPFITKLVNGFSYIFSLQSQKSTISGLQYSMIDNHFEGYKYNHFLRRSELKGFQNEKQIAQAFNCAVRILSTIIYRLFKTIKVLDEYEEPSKNLMEAFALRLLLQPKSPFYSNLKKAFPEITEHFEAAGPRVSKLRTSKLKETILLHPQSSSIAPDRILASVSIHVKTMRIILEEKRARPIYRLTNFLIISSLLLYRRAGFLNDEENWDLEVCRAVASSIPADLAELVMILSELGLMTTSEKFNVLREELGKCEEDLSMNTSRVRKNSR